MKQREMVRAAYFAVATVVVLFCAMPIQAAPIVNMKDSSDFGIYQYEMNVNPSGQDLDANTALDFQEFSGTAGTFGGGILTLNNTGRYYESSGGSPQRAWPKLGATLATGYTFEARLKVVSEAGSGNADGATMLAVGLGAPGPADALLSIGDDTVKWGTGSGAVLLSTKANTDDFHIFRIALGEGQVAGSEVFSVWRDGELLSSTLGDVFATPLAFNRLDFGDLGGTVAGNVQYDYVRFTAGAFAPIPEPGTLSMFVLGGLAVVMVGLGRRGGGRSDRKPG